MAAIITVSDIGPVSPWQPNMPYLKDASVTPRDVDDPEVTLPQGWFVCVRGGTSGASPPAWPGGTGVLVDDGTVIWMSYGTYPN